MFNYRIDIRKIRLPQHRGFSSHRLNNLGRWEVEVLEFGDNRTPNFEFIYQDYFNDWEEALEAGYEAIEQRIYDPMSFS
jgi:hypothetical protein